MGSGQHVKLWLADQALSFMQKEAARKYPLETGGVLMGYQVPESREVVVTAAIGPGPMAVHSRTRFIPDAAWQLARISEIYAESARAHTYLGEWHIHPGGTCHLSLLDRKTLCRIASTPEARAPEPVMLILAGQPEQWKIEAVRLRSNGRFCIFRQLDKLEVSTYKESN